jgi:hypothetical protein
MQVDASRYEESAILPDNKYKQNTSSLHEDAIRFSISWQLKVDRIPASILGMVR